MNIRSTILPKPDPESQSHSEMLLRKILKEIALHGPIPFSRYMELALYAPGLGYYCAGNTKFGKEGDFVTAPEISPLFSCCLANQCQQVLKELQGGIILELGAGSGQMACDLLIALEAQACLPEHYWILDLSPDLKNRQENLFKEKIPHLLDRIQWLSTLPEDPFQGIILANEVMDAMPVHRFKQEATLKEYYVGCDQDNLTWILKDADNPLLIEAVKALELAEGYISEINLAITPWLSALSQSLKKGLLLVIDYGYTEQEYYHPQRIKGTLTCFYRHRAHDNPLILPGIQDITAHVNFTALGEAGIENGFHVAGYSNQMHFLIHCGIMNLVDPDLDAIEQFKIHQQIKQLILPTEMGELFKVMALTKNLETRLLGFME